MVQHRIPSPCSSIRTSATAPNPRSFNHGPLFQTNLSPIDQRIDPALVNNSFHYVGPGHFSSMSPAIARLYQDDLPWSAGNLRASKDVTRLNRNHFGKPGGQYTCFSQPKSDIEVSDSGYQSQQPSVLSTEAIQPSLESVSSMVQQCSEPQGGLSQNEALYSARLLPDQRSQVSRQSGRSGKSFDCDQCGESMKCKSELKYVPKGSYYDIAATKTPTESTSSSTISPTNVMLRAAQGPKDSLPSMIWIVTRRACIALVFITVDSSVHLQIVRTRERCGLALTILNSTLAVCIATKTLTN